MKFVPRRIILHHSATVDSGTVSWLAIRAHHIARGFSDIGYHFGIEYVKNSAARVAPVVMLGRSLLEPGAHTKGANPDSIGICVTGNFDIRAPSAEIEQKVVDLCHWLCILYRIEPSQIYGHRDFAAKSCPGREFPLSAIRTEVAERLDAGVA